MPPALEIPYLVFEASGACNLRCRYCYNVWQAPAGGPAPPDGYALSLRTLKAVFRQARVGHVTFTGGEPLLAERFAELVLFVRRRGKRVTIISNGNAAGRETYRTLLSLGVELFEFPLHAPGPAPHDALTGVPGSWARSRRSLAEVLELGGAVAAVIVLTSLNVERAGETIRHLAALGVRRVLLARFNPGGRGLREWRTLLPSGEQLRAAFATADRLAMELGLQVSANVCVPVCVLEPRDYPHVWIAHCTTDPRRRPLTLDAAGNVRLCNHSPVVAGNVLRQSLDEILDSPYLRAWGERVPAFCRGCDDWGRCLGGCRAAAEQLGGTLADVDPVVEALATKGVRPAGWTSPG